MQTGSINANSTSSAFLATVDDQMFVQTIKVYQIDNSSDKDSFAASCTFRVDGFILGSIGTNTQHYMFYIRSSDSRSLTRMELTNNLFSDSKLFDFDVSEIQSAMFAYYSSMAGGNKQIIVNWKRKVLGETKNYMLYVRKEGYHTYHTKKQIGFNHHRWSAYIQQNISDPSEFLT